MLLGDGWVERAISEEDYYYYYLFDFYDVYYDGAIGALA